MEKGRRSAESAYKQPNHTSHAELHAHTCTIYSGPQANKMAELALN